MHNDHCCSLLLITGLATACRVVWCLATLLRHSRGFNIAACSLLLTCARDIVLSVMVRSSNCAFYVSNVFQIDVQY